MMALIGVFRLIPGWLYAVIACVALAAAGGAYERHQGAESVQALWDADKAARAIADASAIADRVAKNEVLATQQAADTAAITKVHDAEITSLRARIDATPRLRIGTSFCGGITASADPQSPIGGTGGDSSGRILSDELDGAVKTLILQSEMAAATGRACQAFVRDNGMDK